MDKPQMVEKAYKNLEFLNSRGARTIRILSEYIEPLQRLAELKVNSTVLFVGSAKAEPEDKNSLLYKYYWEAEELAFKLAREATGNTETSYSGDYIRENLLSDPEFLKAYQDAKTESDL